LLFFLLLLRFRQWFSLLITGCLDQRSYATSGLLVLGWVGKPSWYVTSHPGHFSLAMPLRVGVTSTSKLGHKHAHHDLLALYAWLCDISRCLDEDYRNTGHCRLLAHVAWVGLYV